MTSQDHLEIKGSVEVVLVCHLFRLLKLGLIWSLDNKGNIQHCHRNILFNVIICRKDAEEAGPYLMASLPRMDILLKKHVLHILEERRENHVAIFNLVNHMLELVTVTTLIITILVQLKNKFKKNF